MSDDESTIVANGRQGMPLRLPKGYGEAVGTARTLTWNYVVNRVTESENFWLATTRPDGRPHVTPVWGVWVDDALYFDGIPTARWARNLAQNPALAVHLESGTDVIILEGMAEDLETDADLGQRIVEAWNAKYGRLTPEPVTSGILRLRPRYARAWTQFPEDATRWSFSPG